MYLYIISAYTKKTIKSNESNESRIVDIFEKGAL